MVSFMQNLGYFYMNVMIQDYKWKLQVNFLENAMLFETRVSCTISSM